MYVELGEPVIPSLVVDGNTFPLLHVSQIASILGLPMPDTGDLDTARLCYDSLAILQSWQTLLERLDYDRMLQPTRSRGRTPRNLTVNVFEPFALLPGAWVDGTFEWHTDESDESREAALTDADSVRAYARDCLLAFQRFVVDHEEDLGRHDPWIRTSTRGEASFSVIVHAQRSHAAVHHRQLVDFFDQHGIATQGALDVDGIADLRLPEKRY